MPTGYTAGILDGEITTFPQFVKLCMRNFGATIHMRDESFDKEYEPRKVSTYHNENIKQIKKEIELLEKTSDEQLIKNEKKRLKEAKENALKYIEERKENRKKLEKLLEEAKAFEPPTTEHIGIKNFMIEQLETTIDFDCDTKYTEEELERIALQEKSIDAIVLRQNKKESLEEDLQYHLKHHKEEVLRVTESNKWVEDLLNAVDKPQSARAKKKKE